MTILCKVPDSVVMTRSYFQDLLKRNATARSFGFSKKHTADILQSRGNIKFPDKMYNLPVLWDTEYTYLAS